MDLTKLFARWEADKDRIHELQAENAKLIKALHLITNLAHPQNPEIFKAAMDALGLEANDE